MSEYSKFLRRVEAKCSKLTLKTLDIFNVTVYGYNMSQHKKLLSKAQRNPSGLSFSEFQTLMNQCGWEKDHQKGSHQIWYSPQGARVSIQNRGGMAKGYQVRQFLDYQKGEEI